MRRRSPVKTRASEAATDTALWCWHYGMTSPQCLAEVKHWHREELTPGQITAIIARAKRDHDHRATKHNANAVYVT